MKKSTLSKDTEKSDAPSRAGHGEPKLKRRDYEKELQRLQAELCALQDWVRHTGQRIVIVFEGRDAAGKGGTIKAITERISPRVVRVVALPTPSDREKSQMYVQRYLKHFPAAGEIVLFDRSWYNRAGIELVLGFCTAEQHGKFLTVCPQFERHIVDNGIRLIKYWLEVGDEEQKRRFEARIEDPVRQWKLSPTDLESRAALVRLLTRPRSDARRHRHRLCTLVHRALRRQAPRAAQLHRAPPEPVPLRARATPRGADAAAIQEGRLRRRGGDGTAPLDPGEVLISSIGGEVLRLFQSIFGGAVDVDARYPERVVDAA